MYHQFSRDPRLELVRTIRIQPARTQELQTPVAFLPSSFMGAQNQKSHVSFRLLGWSLSSRLTEITRIVDQPQLFYLAQVP